MKKTFFAGALALALAACNSSDSDGGVRNLVDEDVRESGIVNTWKSECQNVLLDLFGLAAQREEFRIAGDIRKVTTYYETNDCKDAIIEVQETGSYDNVDKSGDNFEIDIHWDKVELKAINDRGRDLLETVQFCGFETWNVDQYQNVTDRTSDNPVIDRCWTKTPRDQFDLFRVDGDTLYFGSSADKSAPEGRPTSVDESVPYKK